jgi:metallo-beta-lactamase class B
MTGWRGEAFHMIGNVHYVGTETVSSHLLTSDEGHILLDACMPDSGPSILAGIRDLGFDPGDVAYVLISHGHVDHLGSAAFLAAETGAKLCIGAKDIEAAEKGSETRLGLTGYRTFTVDRVLIQGDVIAVGDTSVTVYHTPGHTPGCCSFGFAVQEGDCIYRAMLFGGAGVNVFAEENVRRGIYAGTLDELRATLARLLSLEVDIPLGNHPVQNDTFGKLEQLRQGVSPNPYIDPDGWRAFLRECIAGAETFI